MTHCDDETLTLLAFGETPTRPHEVDAHLAECAECRAALQRLRDTVAVGRSLEPDDLRLPAPPDRVWERVTADLGIAAIADDADADADVVDLHAHAARRARSGGGRWRWLAAAAAVLLLVTTGAVLLVRRDSDPASTVQEVSLAPVGSGSARGTAQLVREDGHLAVRVDTSGLPNEADAYYELWLMNPAANSFVSLGPLVPGTSTVRPLPAGFSVKRNPYVDVSVQPFDGNPAHSNLSALRGRFA